MEDLVFFATCPRGLESTLATELAQLRATSIEVVQGGVIFQGGWQTCYQANLESRIASRILWRIAQQDYRSEADIYQIAFQLPWHTWFSPKLTIRVKVSAIKCALRSLDFVTLKIKDAVCDKFRKAKNTRPDVDTANPAIRIHGFLDRQQFTLYLDTSGETLFKRNLRKSAGDAPIRENLAAGILALAGWKPNIPLFDPMCGSGTFLMEAAQISCRIAPGINRHFAFEQFSLFDSPLWKQLREAALAQRLSSCTSQLIFGSDLSGYALDDARENLISNQLAEIVQLKQANILEVNPPYQPGGIIVMNPPYGVRMSEQQLLADFYPKLGDRLKKKFSGWCVYILTADSSLPKLIRLNPSRRIPLFNGALECRLLEYRMIEGSMRKGDSRSSNSTPAELTTVSPNR
ncbi:MAG: class I SAM-dependent RNA methyltransferase [Nitrosomonas sp.]|nr:class I SAM-dependent RNA methyltransferase [Nitrosomonas sp.]